MSRKLTQLSRKLCPEPVWVSGVYIGLYVVKTSGDSQVEEFFPALNLVTNTFHDRKDPLGAGIIIGSKLTPFANSVVVSPFLSFDYIHAPVNHTFPNGSFLGSTANVAGTAGVKVGPQLPMGVWLYGVAGVSLLNETLNINFIPVASSTTATVPGATLGVGAAFQPNFLQGFSRPVSLFVEYQHTWWQDAHFDAPPASPAFNYTFRRQDDFFKFGFLVSLDAPPPPPAPSYPVKAPRLK